MAEYISMKQVPGGTVTSVDDRILYDINLTNGKIYGCEVSYLGNNMIHINAGYGVIKGGLFEIEDHTEYVDFAESEPTPGQIYLHFDAAAQDKLTIVKETSANAHQLVQNEDANYESGVYEIQICTFTATTTALTDVTETWPTASGAMETLGTMEEVMANTEAGKVADALVTKQLNSNLTNNLGMPIRVDSVTNKPQWKDVGADTWNFFKSDLVASSFEQIGTLYVPTRTTVTYTFPSNYGDYDYFVVTRGRADMGVEFPNMDIIFNTENTFWVKANGDGTPQYVFHNGDYYYTKTEIIYGIKS